MMKHQLIILPAVAAVAVLTACSSPAPVPTPAPSAAGDTITVGAGSSSVCAQIDSGPLLLLVPLSSSQTVTVDDFAPGVVQNVRIGEVWVVPRGPEDSVADNGLTIEDVPVDASLASLAAWEERVPVEGATLTGGDDYALAVEIGPEPGTAGYLDGFSLTYADAGDASPRTATSGVGAGFGDAGRLPTPANECQQPAA
jgi:hypothetical protein